ncbi:hypothetical protein N658DRAFT_4976 [Parathielavia hyrcaniae]|uniref:Uncharacterized protein n=1 Tax=Parathielavia hyrcaniae TaxID=113614 RepID=A0AAN6QD31_9PEZI|nr:hypothetical protein N658DRAFT_4976 [Parathielavia hyrcaniae]
MLEGLTYFSFALPVLECLKVDKLRNSFHDAATTTFKSQTYVRYSQTYIQPNLHTAKPTYSQTYIQPNLHTAKPTCSQTYIPGVHRLLERLDHLS